PAQHRRRAADLQRRAREVEPARGGGKGAQFAQTGGRELEGLIHDVNKRSPIRVDYRKPPMAGPCPHPHHGVPSCVPSSFPPSASITCSRSTCPPRAPARTRCW